MKKILLVSLLAISTLMFVSCDEASSLKKEMTDTNDIISKKEEITNVNDTIPPNFRFITYSESSEISEVLNNNPIDTLYFKELKDVVTNVDIVNIYQRYLDIWRNELDMIVERIEKSIPEEKLEEFQISQEAWESFYEINPNIAVDIYSYKMGTGSVVHEIYGDKALYLIRYRTLELAEYCYLLTGDFEFDFN